MHTHTRIHQHTDRDTHTHNVRTSTSRSCSSPLETDSASSRSHRGGLSSTCVCCGVGGEYMQALSEKYAPSSSLPSFFHKESTKSFSPFLFFLPPTLCSIFVSAALVCRMVVHAIWVSPPSFLPSFHHLLPPSSHEPSCRCWRGPGWCGLVPCCSCC